MPDPCVRNEGRREHTKHLLRLRHASQINGAEANEIVLLNSHDGTSSIRCWLVSSALSVPMGWCVATPLQMCACPHKGNVAGHVIEGAYQVLSGFERVKESAT